MACIICKSAGTLAPLYKVLIQGQHDEIMCLKCIRDFNKEVYNDFVKNSRQLKNIAAQKKATLKVLSDHRADPQLMANVEAVFDRKAAYWKGDLEPIGTT